MAERLIIFDADDTLRRTTVSGQPCPHRQGQWELLPHVRAKLHALSPGVRLGVASNQDHVGYGHLSFSQARALLDALLLEAAGRRVPPPALALCPHVLETPCWCRKPAPGMLLCITRFYDVDTAHTLFVGNSATDRLAAWRAGIRFCWAHDYFEW